MSTAARKLMTTNFISATPYECVKTQRDELAKHLERMKDDLKEAIEVERACRQSVGEVDEKLKEFDAWLEKADAGVERVMERQNRLTPTCS